MDTELVAVDRADGNRLKAFQELSTRARGMTEMHQAITLLPLSAHVTDIRSFFNRISRYLIRAANYIELNFLYCGTIGIYMSLKFWPLHRAYYLLCHLLEFVEVETS